MRSISNLSKQHGWLFLTAWAVVVALASSSASCFAQYNAQQQQQYQYQMYQQQQMLDQQRRQQEQARQQQAYQETIRLQQQQQSQQDAARRMQEEDIARRRRYNDDEEARRKVLLQRNQSSSTNYQVYDSNGDENSDAESRPESIDEAAERELTTADNGYFRGPLELATGGANLFWLAAGVVAAVALFRHAHAFLADVWRGSLSAADDVLHWFSLAINSLARRAHALSLNTRRIVRHSIRSAKRLMNRYKPSRQFMRRMGDVALVATLLLLSSYAVINLLLGFVFVSPETLVAFVLLTIGYLVAILIWLRPRVSQQQTVEAAVSTTRQPKRSHAFSNANPIPVPQLTPPPALTIVSDFNSVMDVNKLSAESAPSPSREAPPASPPPQRESLGRLCCDHCQKQFNVRGHGELAVRLILCPNCAVAMRRSGDQQVSALEGELPFAPILSASCSHCHSLIDIPYASIGRAISCPRCDTDMFVPDNEGQVKRLQGMRHLVRA